MSRSRVRPFTHSFLAAILGGCAAPGSLGPAPVYQNPTNAKAFGRASWMSARAATGKTTLLYVSDFYGNRVHVYDFKSGMPVGTLTGFRLPGPGCVDRKGDVFITNLDSGRVLEFKNGGTKPIHRYDAGAYAKGCSVDRNGSLAVSAEVPGAGPAQVCVWKSGKAESTCYSNRNSCASMGAPGYDDRGNLYVEGYGFAPSICELPAGGTSLKPVRFSGATLSRYLGVMWDGKYLTFSYSDTGPPENHLTTLYRATESPSGDLTVAGWTVLKDSCNNVYTWVDVPFIVGRKNTPINEREGTIVVGPNEQCRPAPIDYWSYTRGSEPIISWKYDYSASGTVVSIPE